LEGIDTNILVYAFDTGSVYHNDALSFIENKVTDDTLAILLPLPIVCVIWARDMSLLMLSLIPCS